MKEINEIGPDHITAADIRIPCEYTISSTGRSITCRLDMDGAPFRLVLSGVCGEIFAAARRACQGETVAVDGEGLMIVLGTAKECKPRAEKSTDPAKQAHGPVPEKWFIGQSYTGKGWKILFDGDAGKTRVIFPRKPAPAMLDAVKAAGFYWSPTLNSWNKGLTFRAFRAAEQLRVTLGNLSA